MVSFDPKAFGKRIRHELELANLDVKAFRARIIAMIPKARGTSYGAIWSYVNDRAPLEPRREVVDAMASVLGVLPSYLLGGGPRTAEAKASADSVETVEIESFTQAIIDEALPEFADFAFDNQALAIQCVARFQDAAPSEWFANKTAEFHPHFFAFLAMLRQAVLMPLWAWSDAPDLKGRAEQDYIRCALTAFAQSIPRRLPRAPLLRLETYHGQSPTNPHSKADAMHGVQSAIAFEIERLGESEAGANAKHLRTGINSCLVESFALAQLLMAKGVFTEDEYLAAIADAAERELSELTQRLRKKTGISNISFG